MSQYLFLFLNFFQDNQIELNKAEKYHFKNPEKTKILKFYIEEVAENEKEGTEE
jgi:hypothetical protein